MQPLYTAANCCAAYQLNWSVSVFGKAGFPSPTTWLDALRLASAADGVEILECRAIRASVVQFLVSTRPAISPSEIVRSIKGRWQYLLRASQPAAFRRNYRIDSVGAANSKVVDDYVARQNAKHPMADPRIQRRLVALQFHNPAIDLSAVQTGNYGQFVYGLQMVIETAEHWHETRTEVLEATREMVIRASEKKNWRLSRIGVLSNHLHILLGAAVTESPESVVLSLLNNLASVHEMKPAYRFSYYVGTVGGYDRQAVRRALQVDRGQVTRSVGTSPTGAIRDTDQRR